MRKYISRSLFIEIVGFHQSQPHGFHYVEYFISKGFIVHIVSEQTNGSASRKAALTPLNVMKRIEKLHASNVHAAKNWERKQIGIFNEQLSCQKKNG